tara:strand:- start:7320 stop:7541 length:222 start_codon:yes stop_codon:yes gene_type:complete
MSQEELSDFVQAVEHSLSLRKKIYKVNNLNELISIASSYGFNFSINDIKNDLISDEAKKWFKESEIPAIRKPK